ncbi:MAG: hypothetical protein EXS68_01730 [Candidatus Ryanbacteria bacterium]|nr:hypothetical protein [Candidatus Ryanbacteria bacterium]
MLVGILFSVLVSIAIGSFSVLTFLTRYRVNPRYERKELFSFALFWYVMGVVWYLLAGADFFGYIERKDLATMIIYIMQFFVGFSLVVAAHHFRQALFPNLSAMLIHFLYGLGYIAFLISLVLYPIDIRPESFFTSQIITSDTTTFIFTMLFIPLLVAAIYGLVKAFRARGADFSGRRFALLANSSFILLGITGFLDETGVITDWHVTVSRLITLISAILAYFAIAALQEPDELVI